MKLLRFCVFLLIYLYWPSSFCVASELNIALADELLAMQKVDSLARQQIIEMINPTERDWERIAAIDHEHGQRIKEIVQQYGWPRVSLIGHAAADAIWLLVQHQDEDVAFQKECLALLEKTIHENDAPKRHYA